MSIEQYINIGISYSLIPVSALSPKIKHHPFVLWTFTWLDVENLGLTYGIDNHRCPRVQFDRGSEALWSQLMRGYPGYVEPALSHRLFVSCLTFPFKLNWVSVLATCVAVEWCFSEVIKMMRSRCFQDMARVLSTMTLALWFPTVVWDASDLLMASAGLLRMLPGTLHSSSL